MLAFMQYFPGFPEKLSKNNTLFLHGLPLTFPGCSAKHAYLLRKIFHIFLRRIFIKVFCLFEMIDLHFYPEEPVSIPVP